VLFISSSQTDSEGTSSLARQATKLPGPGSIIVSSCTSPLDAIYLAAIFDPIFTTLYPSTRLVERVTLPVFLYRYFVTPSLYPPPSATLIPLPTLLGQNPNRMILLFPEATPTNGKGILKFTPALNTAPSATKIFPVSLKYTPADITTPIPNTWARFFWALLSRPTHCIRVRIAETIYNHESDRVRLNGKNGTGGGGGGSSSDTVVEDDDEGGAAKKGVCERGAEALARIGRVKRLNLGVKEKIGFVKAWRRRNRIR
jgi:hypothetical protein